MVSRIVYKFRAAVIPFTEQRVKLMNEIITAIKLVKMYAWEKPFARKIQGRQQCDDEISLFILLMNFISSHFIFHSDLSCSS